MTVCSFHIPVMGIAFTMDFPLNVAPFGIDSAISPVDDVLLGKLINITNKDKIIFLLSLHL
jgi:hypothetical protein